MSKTEKMKKAFDNLCVVCEHIAGLEKEDILKNKILGSAPEGMAADDPQRDCYIGMDQVDMMKFMMFTEQEFNKEIDDAGFVPRTGVKVEDLWQSKTVEDLMTFCAENMIDD